MGEHDNAGACAACKRRVEERCGDDVCRACHKSLTFEDCVSGRWVECVRKNAGLPPSFTTGRREDEATSEDRREWAAEDKHDLEKEGGWEP